MNHGDYRRDRGPGRDRDKSRDPVEPRGGVDRFAQRALEIETRRALPEVSLKSYTAYPLIYRKRVAKVGNSAKPGDLVVVYAPPPVERPLDAELPDDPESEGSPPPLSVARPFGADDRDSERLVGYGFFNPKSEILVRIVRKGDDLPDAPYFDRVLDRATRLRKDLLQLDAVTDAYRVVHAEADGLSGLVIDRFGDVLSAEAFSLGMYLRAQAMLDLLHRRLGTQHTLIRPSPHFLAQEGYDAPIVESEGLPRQVNIVEHGVRFRVRFEGGHKTGFFCDQRDNRKRLAELARGKTVLDLCCYTGGFAVSAKKAGATAVTAVDLDADPIALAKENANLNQVRVDFAQADAFTYMRDRLAHGERYDVVVLDPPKLIRSRLEFEEGRRKYFDLNRLALQLVKPGGLFLSCSCSGLMPEEEFSKLVFQASRQAGAELPEKTPTGKPKHAPRDLQILARSGAASDHPVSPYVPETGYLKAVWARVD